MTVIRRRDASNVAAELYARGFTATREEATALVDHEPDVVATLLGLAADWGEMRHNGDKADPPTPANGATPASPTPHDHPPARTPRARRRRHRLQHRQRDLHPPAEAVKRTKVCPNVTAGVSCPNLAPCPIHTRPANAPWSKGRDFKAHARLRRYVIQARGAGCERCGQQALDASGRGLQMHHVKPGDTPASVILLCRDCHKALDTHAR